MKFVYLTSLTIILLVNACSPPQYAGPLTPEEALQSFQLSGDFEIEVFASEPHVWDPVCMVFDENGDAYVVEMPDYPYKPKPEEARGRIKKLIDEDQDGRIDNTIVFVDSLSEATSILPWKGGLLVTAAPHIFYFKDTDSDGVADEKEILFSGFFENNSEAQISNLRFNVDNWIYASNFGQAGEVIFHRDVQADTLSMQGGDFRFRLDRGLFELAAGPTQFGQAIDDWGNRFVSQNTLHIRQTMIPWRYLHRHGFLPSTNSLQNISDHELEMFQQTPPPYWRAERTRRRQKRYKEQKLDRVEYAEDHFTGSSGATFYGGDAFAEGYYGNIFSGDVAGNLIHRDVLSSTDGGPAFVASRALEELKTEFLTSTDPWFRPANFTVGPDGYLYVVDMYRQHIETPLSIPEDLKAEMDFYNGMEHGRIYRIKPGDIEERGTVQGRINALESRECVKMLAHPNQWNRLQAQRILLERQDLSIKEELIALFENHDKPQARLHALYVLEGLNMLDEAIVQNAIQDAHPALRKHGVILAERYSTSLPLILESISDEDVNVAFQACLSAGEFAGENVVERLAFILTKYGHDSWFRTAVLSSEAGSSLELFELLLAQNYFTDVANESRMGFLKDFAHIMGRKNQEKEINKFVALIAGPDFSGELQLSAIEGMSAGIKKAKTTPVLTIQSIELLESMKSGDIPDINGIIDVLLEGN